MRIPDHKIDEVRSASDIVDVVAAHVQLKKRGKNFLGLCPFHQEKTPSFTVSAEKQMYHCFGCHKGGNVFTFVMEYEKVSFIEAVRSLAERAGVSLPTEHTSPEQQTEIEALYNVCRFAGLQFHNNLTKTDEGRSALEYFHSRGFTDETIRGFGLGYALNAWDSLLRKATEEGHKVDHLVKAGLVRAREDGSHYDYFRGRAMFPIFSTTGRVIAFGARKMREEDQLGKYINSPETPIYSKSRVLFGLFQSKEHIRGEDNAFMVEGYADLISLYQSGVRNVVASSGTALTQEHLQLLGRYSRKITLVYDADSAGSSATGRGVDMALEQDFDVRVVELPEGDDPDSFVRKHGGTEFLKRAEVAVSFIDFTARQFQKAGAFATPEGKAQAVRSIVQSIAKMKDELKRNFYVKEVAEKYEVYESALYRELDRWISRDRPTKRDAPGGQRVPMYDVSLSDVTLRRTSDIPAGERDILKVLLEGDKEVVDFVSSNVSIEEVKDSRIRRIVELLILNWKTVGEFNVAKILNEIEDVDLKSTVTDIAIREYEMSKRWRESGKEIDEAEPMEIALDALRYFKRKALENEIAQLQKLIKETNETSENGLLYRRRWHELSRQLKGMESDKFIKDSVRNRFTS